MKKHRPQRNGFSANPRSDSREDARRDKGRANDRGKDRYKDKTGFGERSFRKSDSAPREDARRDERRGNDRSKDRYKDKIDFREKNFKKPDSHLRADGPRDERRGNYRNKEDRYKDKPGFRKDKAGFREKSFRKPEPPAFEKIERRSDTILLWGFHAVRAAWLNPKRKCFRLWVTEAAHQNFEGAIVTARDDLLKRPDPKRSERHELDRLTPPGSVHQGIVLEAAPLQEPSLHDLISGDNPPDYLIMLDQVTDPHNIGAILRSAAAFGTGGIILTERNAPSMTGVLAKAASGAADHVPQVHVVNLSRALDELRDAGYWSVGLAEEGEKNLDACDLSGRTVLVLGAEGEGLRQLTRKKCDELARLPTGGPIDSLNVSNAAAIALYEAKRQKKSG